MTTYLAYFSFFLLIFLTVKPIIWVCASVLLDYWASSYPVGPVPLRNYLVPLLLLLGIIKSATSRSFIKFDRNAAKLIIVCILFITFAILCRAYHDEPLKPFIGRIIVPFFVMLCCVYFVDTISRLKMFLYTIGAAIIGSSLVGIAQFFHLSWAWDLHTALNPDILLNEKIPDIYNRERIAGLSGLSIQFGYALCAFVPVFLLLSQAKNSFSKRSRGFFLATFFSGGFAILLTLSRSAILGTTIGLIWVLLKNYKLTTKISLILTTIVFFSLIALTPAVSDRITTNDDSSRGTLARIVLGTSMAVENPLGTGGGSSSAFWESAEKHWSEIFEMEGSQSVNIEASHNQFLNTAIYYGIWGFALLLLLYHYTFRLLAVPVMRENDLISNCMIGAKASLIGYTVHSLFHNAGPFIGEQHIWYLLATIIIINRLNSAYAKN